MASFERKSAFTKMVSVAKIILSVTRGRIKFGEGKEHVAQIKGAGGIAALSTGMCQQT